MLDDPRPSRWNLDEGVWLLGYWTHDWCDEVIRVAAYDKEKKIVTMAAPHNYGIMGGTWGSAKRRFFALNALVLSETDRACLERLTAVFSRVFQTAGQRVAGDVPTTIALGFPWAAAELLAREHVLAVHSLEATLEEVFIEVAGIRPA